MKTFAAPWRRASSAGLAAAVVALTSCASCARHVPPSRASAAAGDGATARAAASIGSGATWSYAVAIGAGARTLDVEASFPPGTGGRLVTDEPGARFVRDLTIATGGATSAGARAVTADGATWAAPECAGGCTVRYRFALADAARELGDVNAAEAYEGAIEAPPSTWLVRPDEIPPGARYRVTVTTAEGVDFATGVTRAPGDASGRVFEAASVDLELAPYSLAGVLRRRTLEAGGATIERAVLPGALAMDDAAIDRWVSLAARAVTGFYGQFPVRHVLLGMAPSRGDGVSGKTLASGGASIMLDVGAGMREADVPRDWVLVHEMTHLALPSLPRGGAWLEEGLATYVEPIARARAGIIPADEVWRGLVDGLPQGQPKAGDRGLDHTPTWGRTYWGGALFCLMADVGIHRATANRKGLDDALRGILRAGGNGEVRWPLARVLEVGDAAVGAHVLTELHARMGSAPVRVDLDALWAQLGVRVRGSALTLDDAAPDAAIRRAITGMEPKAR